MQLKNGVNNDDCGKFSSIYLWSQIEIISSNNQRRKFVHIKKKLLFLYPIVCFYLIIRLTFL